MGSTSEGGGQDIPVEILEQAVINIIEENKTLRAALAVEKERLQRMEEALTPSQETKLAYRFAIPMVQENEAGTEEDVYYPIPWETMKNIMAGIKERAEYNPMDTYDAEMSLYEYGKHKRRRRRRRAGDPLP